jgi:hypothetical protein
VAELPVDQQEQQLGKDAQSWQGQNGANSAWNTAQGFWNVYLPFQIGTLLSVRDALGRIG